MITEIGIVAGEIWQVLEEDGSAEYPALISRTGRSRGSVLMALGWLAREGHVILTENQGRFQVTLSRKESSESFQK